MAPLFAGFGFAFLGVFWLYGLCFSEARTESWCVRILRISWIQRLGECGLGIYLFHLSILGHFRMLRVWDDAIDSEGAVSWTLNATKMVRFFPAFVVALVSTYFLAWFSYRVVEVPASEKVRQFCKIVF